jgi:hypothetical protein
MMASSWLCLPGVAVGASAPTSKLKGVMLSYAEQQAKQITKH